MHVFHNQQGVRRKNFQRVRSVIEGRLFLAKPTFAPHLRELWSYVADLRHVHFAWANPNHMYILSEYAELQVATREQKAKPALEAVVDKIQKVRACCVHVLCTAAKGRWCTGRLDCILWCSLGMFV